MTKNELGEFIFMTAALSTVGASSGAILGLAPTEFPPAIIGLVAGFSISLGIAATIAIYD